MRIGITLCVIDEAVVIHTDWYRGPFWCDSRAEESNAEREAVNAELGAHV